MINSQLNMINVSVCLPIEKEWLREIYIFYIKICLTNENAC